MKPFDPAIALMNRLTYPQKFLLISVLFILPLVLVMYLLLSELSLQRSSPKKNYMAPPTCAPSGRCWKTFPRVGWPLIGWHWRT